jgi:hypothetical protein
MKRATLMLATLALLFVGVGQAKAGLILAQLAGSDQAFEAGLKGLPSDSQSFPLLPTGSNPPIVYDKAFISPDGVSTSEAAGGFGTFTNSKSAIVTFAEGMGVTQSSLFSNEPVVFLKAQANAVFTGKGDIAAWNIFYSFPAEVNVGASPGDFSRVDVFVEMNAHYSPKKTGGNGFWSASLSDSFTFDKPGTFDLTLSNRKPAPAIPDSFFISLQVHAFLEFSTQDPGSPTGVKILGGGVGTEGFAAATPEPASLTLLGLGSLGLLSYGWRRRKQAGA